MLPLLSRAAGGALLLALMLPGIAAAVAVWIVMQGSTRPPDAFDLVAWAFVGALAAEVSVIAGRIRNQLTTRATNQSTMVMVTQ
mgnify:CR=1 FL=1